MLSLQNTISEISVSFAWPTGNPKFRLNAAPMSSNLGLLTAFNDARTSSQMMVNLKISMFLNFRL